MGLAWLFLAGLGVAFGLPLGAVGVILRLTEGLWEKPAGALGSTRCLAAAAVLCLPAAGVLVGMVVGR
jgi:hypothetical protein